MAQPNPEQAADQSLDTSHPFTTGMALEAGITAGALRGPRFRRLFKGVYVSADSPPTPVLRAEAALLLQPPHAFASHFSAARILDLPVPNHPHEHVSVATAGDRRARAGIDCHVATPGAKIIVRQGVRLSPRGQLFIEMASVLTFVDLVILGDAIVRKSRLTPADLVAVCESSDDKHAKRALHAAGYVRQGVDSPMETRLRLLIVLAGLPEPEVDFKIYDDQGNVLRRFDLSYPDLKLIVEYDGRQHAEDTVQYDIDIYRREDLDRWGWRIVVVTAKGIYQKPEETLFRVHRELKERRAPGLPRQLSDAWRAHFPVREPLRRSS
jgi:very-short-patch-repair endonuclease